MTREELEKTVTEFMDRFTTMTLACSRGGMPWAAAVYYARQGLDLVFFSSPRSIHSTVLTENPKAAAEIHGDCPRWQEIKGLQMEGRVERITAIPDMARATALYVRRFPFVRDLLSDPGSFSPAAAAQMARVALYRFRPRKIFYLDNERGFGNRWTLEIGDGRPR
jgi:uncharacterized protein